MTPNRTHALSLYNHDEAGLAALDSSPVALLSLGEVAGSAAAARQGLSDAPALAVLAAQRAWGAARTRATGLGARLRSFLFNGTFLAASFATILAALSLTLLPARKPMARLFQTWGRATLGLMRLFGQRVRYEGREHLPEGACILAAKHQSEADGIALIAAIPDLACVAMQEIARYPLVGPVLRKLAMVLVDTEGGQRERDTLLEGGRAAAKQGRKIVIFPEGTLMKVGERGRYRAGVYHLARSLGLRVVPVATNMGLVWDRRQCAKATGTATVKFLPALDATALDKETFMTALAARLEDESNALAARG